MIPNRLMPWRYDELTHAVQGLAKTGVALIAATNRGLQPAGISDDPGMYYFIPKLVQWFGWPLDRAITVFCTGILLLSFLVGLAGAWKLLPHRTGRVAAAIALTASSLVAYNVYDVYLIPVAVTVAVMPWILYALHPSTGGRGAILVGFLAGAAIGAGHLLRSHSGTAILVFLAVVVPFGRLLRVHNRLALVGSLVVGLLLPIIAFRLMLSHRNAYLTEQHVVMDIDAKHVLWHQVYLGFGFLDNSHGIHYEDAVAIKLAEKLSPGVVIASRDYERILKDETFKLVKEDPRLVIQTLFAKAGLVLLFLAVFGGVGLVFALRRANPLPLDLAFLAAIAFSCLPGLLIMPFVSYLTGAIAFCALWSALGVANASARKHTGQLVAFPESPTNEAP